MRILTSLLMVVLTLLAVQSQGQTLTKAELKTWKKEAKKYQKSPAALKALIDEVEDLRQERDQFQEQLNTQSSDRAQLERNFAQVQQERDQLNTSLQSAQQTISQLTQEKTELINKGAQPVAGAEPKGVVFRIQVGAFEKSRVPENLDTADNIKLEDAEGMQKVLIGQFTSFEDAKQFMNHLKKMGVKGAWVVPFRDGQRITLKEAVGGAGVQ